MTTKQNPATIDPTKYIETRFFGKRPHIRGRRIPVAIIAYNARTNKWTPDELAYNFNVSAAEVLAALLYYQEHTAEIDAQEVKEQQQFDEIQRQHGES